MDHLASISETHNIDMTSDFSIRVRDRFRLENRFDWQGRMI